MPRSLPPPLPDPDVRRLVAAARAAIPRAYAPYSGFRVGAAVLARDGRIFAGCNVENASSPSALCAEQVAVARAVAEGARRFRAMAVAVRGRTRVAPCGRCRQFLSEFGPHIEILMTAARGEPERTTLDRILPLPFRRP